MDILLSLPHIGTDIPKEVEAYNQLSYAAIRNDGDENAREIYALLAKRVRHVVAATIGRAFVDLNRRSDDFGKDGVVKTHTIWDLPIYKEALPDAVKDKLVQQYYVPYHQRLSELAKQDVRLGLDCHTMALQGPALASDHEKIRPDLCLSNAYGTCPEVWLQSMATIATRYFPVVQINQPFLGGEIIRSHAKEIPWIQIEIVREPPYEVAAKAEKILAIVREWYERNFPDEETGKIV